MGTLAGFFLVLLIGGVGFPIPEDLTLIAGGVLAQKRVLRLFDVVVTGIVAVACADWIIYLMGRRYGRDIVELPLLARPFGAGRLDTVRSAVERHGARAVFAARFVFGFRMVTFLGAGTFGVSPLRFGLAEAAGTVIFVPAMVTLGFLFSDRAERIVHDVTRIQHWLVLIGLVALAGYLGVRAWIGRAGLGGGPE
jgi:membrane protein DedA with SNARE-associated domain